MADWSLIIFSSFTKMSRYQNVLLPKCPVAEMSITKMSITKVSFTKTSWIRCVMEIVAMVIWQWIFAFV